MLPVYRYLLAERHFPSLLFTGAAYFSCTQPLNLSLLPADLSSRRR